jgi:uncharacterized Ntn-hydrolase superfamily protein
MMKKLILSFSVFLLSRFIIAQDTFSICAVDPNTGEVGSAGASCISGSIIISDVHPGVGVIHTQALYNSSNQQFARVLMSGGLTPQEIIDSLVVSDSGLNPTIRQYGIAMLVNGLPQTKAFTGVNCMDYKNHIEGLNYTIQGNILSGQHILDSMEARFLNTQGDLACKLMAAMQGAKIVGADTRCLQSGNSSLSAFLKVAKPTDSLNNLFININIPQGPSGFEPIDSLQKIFDMFHNCLTTNTSDKNFGIEDIQLFPNPSNHYTDIVLKKNVSGSLKINLFSSDGKVILEKIISGSEIRLNHKDFSSGLYIINIFRNNQLLYSNRLIIN